MPGPGLLAHHGRFKKWPAKKNIKIFDRASTFGTPVTHILESINHSSCEQYPIKIDLGTANLGDQFLTLWIREVVASRHINSYPRIELPRIVLIVLETNEKQNINKGNVVFTPLINRLREKSFLL